MITIKNLVAAALCWTLGVAVVYFGGWTKPEICFQDLVQIWSFVAILIAFWKE